MSLDSTFEKLAGALSTDFCPGANRWVYWLKNPLWILLLAVAGSAICGFFLNPMVFALTAILVAVAIFGALLPWIAIRGVSCQVLFDVPRVRIGEAALVRLRIRNRSFLPVWGLSLIDGFTTETLENASLEGDEGLAFGFVRGRCTVEHTWPFVPRRRGNYPIDGVARIETSFPFGLFRSQRTAELNGSLLVWPEAANLAGLPDSVQCESADDQFSDRKVGEFGDMLGTRPYRQGDSLRRVHWAQTARQRELIVTERQAPVTSIATVILDLEEASYPEETRFQMIEQSVRIAASVCNSLHSQNCHVELHLGDKVQVGSHSNGGLNRMMDALATANVAMNDLRPRTSSANVRSRGFRVVVTTEHGVRNSNCLQIVVTNPDNSFTQHSNADVANDAGKQLCLTSHAPLSDLVRFWSRSTACLS